MRRTAPGYVQLPHAGHHTQQQHARSPAAAAGAGTASTAGGGSPLARTSTTAASYFEQGSHNDNDDAAASVAAPRPPNSRTKSNSSVHSINSLRSSSSYNGAGSSGGSPSSVSHTATASSSQFHHAPLASTSKVHHGHGHGHGHGQHNSHRYYPGQSPAASSSSSSKTTQADEIEASLRQWRNQLRHSFFPRAHIEPLLTASYHFTTARSVFPSLKAGNYISPGQETPDRDPIHPLVEPILPSIFQAGAPNAKCRVQSYSSAKEFLAALTEEESNEHSWRMEMVLGQTEDLLYSPQSSDGVWLAVWSGEESEGTRMLE